MTKSTTAPAGAGVGTAAAAGEAGAGGAAGEALAGGAAEAGQAGTTPHDPQTGEILPEGEATDAADFLGCETLVKDLTAAFLDRLKWMPKVWQLMTVEEQRSLITSMTGAAEHFVKRAVNIIAKEERPTFEATIEQVLIKDGLKITLTAGRADDNVLAVNRCIGKTVLVIVADADVYMEGAYENKPDAPEGNQADLLDKDSGVQQPGLPLDGEKDKPVFDNTKAGQAG